MCTMILLWKSYSAGWQHAEMSDYTRFDVDFENGTWIATEKLLRQLGIIGNIYKHKHNQVETNSYCQKRFRNYVITDALVLQLCGLFVKYETNCLVCVQAILSTEFLCDKSGSCPEAQKQMFEELQNQAISACKLQAGKDAEKIAALLKKRNIC